MRVSRLIPILMVALTAAGCMHTSVPGSTAAPRDAMPPNLDSIAYERRGAPSAAYAQAQPQQAQPQQAEPQEAQAADAPQVQSRRNARSQPGAAVIQANAIPVVASPAPSYGLDTGDKLRIVVFGQEGLSNSYFVDAAGQVTIPLIGAVSARGLTTQQLARAVAAKLRAGFIREPHVAIEVETYRPFFILGEVTQPGQYPYVPNMTVETAVAIAGGFTPRAYRYDVKIDRQTAGATVRGRSSVPLLTQVQPGDTIVIKERWF
ncbi:MAG TPA: polysaccharide biosynthesis/export family protein [Xanthobacteraceae bacterium]|nr:polysaccharide biosynthesis/export family protein [Xanthobacteraceae bacterium]